MAAPKRDRKKQILVEASRLFSQDGFDKVTVKVLARAVGISEPALYRHYVSKDAIYESVLESVAERLEYNDLFERLEDVEDIDLLLRTLAGHILQFFKANQDLYRLLLYSALKGHLKAKSVFRTIRGTYIKFLIRKLDEFYEKGLIVEKKNDITARCFIGMVFDCSLGSTLWKGFQGREYSPDETIENNIPIYVRGLKA